MGVPTFYRWLCTKYPKVVKDAIEEKEVLEGQGGSFITAPLDGVNPNGIEFDNLYVDMNGVVHPCCHPEDAPPPKDEAEMFSNLCDYLDRIINIVRPRKLVYLALDGVAPRAKMNQQRSRRFKAASEADTKETVYEELKAEFAAQGRDIGTAPKSWDTNCITPGTPFMDRLAQILRYYVAKRMAESKYWQGLTVLLSDSNRPGEGEHKVMQFVRNQRLQPGYDPNTKHCMHGMDADLIMLGLSTHEAHFYIVREVVTDSFQDNKCTKCGEVGHKAADHTGDGVTTQVDIRQNPDAIATYSTFRATWKPLQFLQLPVLREYMAAEFSWGANELLNQDPNDGSLIKVPSEIERHIDDFVLMCFFVGNDFLPHLPSLSIQKGSIDQMMTLYKATYPTLGGYLTNAGQLNLGPLKTFCKYLAAVEPDVLRYDWQRKERQKRQREESALQRGKKRPRPSDIVEEPPAKAARPDETVERTRRDSADSSSVAAGSEDSASSQVTEPSSVRTSLNRDKFSLRQDVDHWKMELKKKVIAQTEVNDPLDNVELGKGELAQGRLRYYRVKFELKEGADVESFAAQVSQHFVRGLQWVLLYYYQGVPSWDWYFPYHYAPLAGDIYRYGFEASWLQEPFDQGKPFSPLEQLMANLPPRSAKFLPECLAELMTNPHSEISDFYPRKFREDQDGKRFKWQWVALLPFIDAARLKAAAEKVIHQLNPAEVRRNTHGQEFLFASDRHPLANIIASVNALKEDETSYLEMPGIVGKLARVDKNHFKKGSRILVDCDGFPAFVAQCNVASYEQPLAVKHRVELLDGTVPPPAELNDNDRMLNEAPGNRFNSKVARRMILQVVGGPHLERWLEKERVELENRRSHFQNVRRSMNYNEETVGVERRDLGPNPLLGSSPPRPDRFPPPWKDRSHGQDSHRERGGGFQGRADPNQGQFGRQRGPPNRPSGSTYQSHSFGDSRPDRTSESHHNDRQPPRERPEACDRPCDRGYERPPFKDHQAGHDRRNRANFQDRSRNNRPPRHDRPLQNVDGNQRFSESRHEHRNNGRDGNTTR